MTGVLVVLLLLALQSRAQAPLFSPAAGQSGLGNSGNDFPFAALPFHYQQVHDLATFSSTQGALLTRLSFRIARGNAGSPGHSIDVELFVARSGNDAARMSTVFQQNIAPGTEVNVFQRRIVQLPRVPDHSWGLAFQFDAPFAFPGNSHLSWRAVVRWVSDPMNHYVLDAWSGAGSMRDGPYAGCAAQNGIVPSRHLAFNHAPGGVNLFSSWSGIPYVSTPFLLSLGIGTTGQWHGIPLPLDLTPYGAPDCRLTHGLQVGIPGLTTADDLGTIVLPVSVPYDPGLVGAQYVSQFLFFSAGANALGMHTSGTQLNTLGTLVGVSRVFAPRDPAAVTGVMGAQFGLAIRFD